MENSEDKFALLAGGGKKLTGEIKRLKEIKPLNFTHKFLKESNSAVSIKKEETIEELYKKFVKEKQDYKKKILPFLNKYSFHVEQDKTELKDFLYKKESEVEKRDFSFVFSSNKDYEKVKIPHYIGEVGIFNSIYKTEININDDDLNKKIILFFESVDYICDVYVNSRLVKQHIGFFSPFEVEVSDFLKKGKNSLVLLIHNLATTSGIDINNNITYGEKIYGCTNIGYDEPKLGWHHCPAGSGIIGRIYLLKSSFIRIRDCFISPNIDTGEINISTDIINYSMNKFDGNIFYSLQGRNFKKDIFIDKRGCLPTLQNGHNQINEKYKIDSFKLWDIDSPYLYDLTISIKDKNNNILCQYQTHFGMRSFKMDLTSKPYKGLFYFNNNRIMLRGTNEMGHLPRAVMEDNIDQLIDDIITAKITGLNYFRMTQRPTLSLIYDYFDYLGMLCQTDFPLFSYIPYSVLGEAYKQVDEMELLTRNHPSVIIESLCNETLDKTAWGKDSYVVSRHEIETFFTAAKNIILLRNPNRVIKYNEGDYAPIKNTYGISDFHCYTYWYISHALPSGKMLKGYLPPIRKEYMCGCGEYGVDGLDRFELMKKYAPKDWLPKNITDLWNPSRIAKSQCFSLHGDFFEEQKNILSWIKMSQEHQKNSISEYVKILRLRSDYIQQSAVHLLIDAWPMGWSKALIDVDRIPKPAYYAFKNASIKTRVALRRDKYCFYNDDFALVEVYAFNDDYDDKKVNGNVSIYQDNQLLKSYSFNGVSKACSSTYFGDAKIVVDKDFEGDIKVVTEMKCDKSVTYDEVNFTVKKRNVKADNIPEFKGKQFENLTKICANKSSNKISFITQQYYLKNKEKIDSEVKKGKCVFISLIKPCLVGDENIVFKTHTLEEEVRANNLLFTSNKSIYTKEFVQGEFKNFYNYKKDYQDLTAWFKFYSEKVDEIIYTLEDNGLNKNEFFKDHKIVVGEMKFGKGKFIISTLSCLDGCLGVNPILDKFLINIIKANA